MLLKSHVLMFIAYTISQVTRSWFWLSTSKNYPMQYPKGIKVQDIKYLGYPYWQQVRHMQYELSD